jgi:hypothetical protein
MLLQIISAFFGLAATISFGQGLSYSEGEHWANVMAMEHFVEQFETRYAEKINEWGLLDKEEFVVNNGEMKEWAKKNCPLMLVMKFGHCLREKIISYERQHSEVADAYEGTRAIVKILRDTLNHIEEEKKLNYTEAEREEENEYELVDEEVVKLEVEKQEWELLLKTLQSKLENLAQHRR